VKPFASFEGALITSPRVQACWGGILPIGITLLSAFVLLESRALSQSDVDAEQKVSVFFSITAMTLGCLMAFIWTARSFRPHSPAFRASSSISTFMAALLLLAMGSEFSDHLDRDYGWHALEEALFTSISLLVCSLILLVLALQKIQAATIQFLTAIGFLAVTVMVQFYLLNGDFKKFPERQLVIWNLNSILVGLALAIWLCAWGAREFQHR
jgi:uncharacterized membrane protein